MHQALNNQDSRWVLLIAGPTASGKSALALEVAKLLFEPVIVNADSMQLYGDLDVLTARPTQANLAQTSHQLYGNFDGGLAFSVARWQEEASRVWQETGSRPLIFVGGTGLYFRALTEGLSPVPPVDGEIRHMVRNRVAAEGPAALHAELDQEMAEQLSPTDSQRVARALEVLLSTGQSLAHWQKQPGEGALVGEGAKRVVLAPPREWLEDRIRVRAAEMLDGEALAEVETLLKRDLSPDLPVMRAIGVSVLAAYLRGEHSRAEALDALVVETRRYAKRQQTWFRGQMTDWPRLDPSVQSVEDMARNIMEME